jgi:16S rRNA (guanine1516-N2)-methyltransferase
VQLDNSPIPLALLTANVNDIAAAQRLSLALKLPLLDGATDPKTCSSAQAVLILDGPSLVLQQTGAAAPGPVAVEFGSPAMRHRRRAGANELLGRAVGVGKKSELHIIDATGGLGRDSFVLADLGCHVSLCEREPVVAALLQSGFDVAAREADPWLRGVLQRLRLCPGDARELIADDLAAIDVIYLDPMFPERSKSAAVKKEMALFQWLLEQPAHSDDAPQLLDWALQQDVARVVVKRPLKGSAIGDGPISHCIRGKAVRYDVYVQRKL